MDKRPRRKARDDMPDEDMGGTSYPMPGEDRKRPAMDEAFRKGHGTFDELFGSKRISVHER